VVLIVTSSMLGSGFVVDKDGLIATNWHVIKADPSRIVVTFSDHRRYEVTDVVSVNEARDLAILKIDAKDLTPLPLGDSDAVHQGDPVVAIGNPRGLERTVSNGLISALRPARPEPGFLLQLSAPIAHGSSGGPALNDKGEVIGVTSNIIPGAGELNFALPSRWLKDLLAHPEPVPLASFAAEHDNAPPHPCDATSPQDCERECRRLDVGSCVRLGNFLYEGRLVRKDPVRAGQLFTFACNKGLVIACSNLGILYEKGEGMEMDIGRAVELYRRACDGGDAKYGCSLLAHMFEQGKGVTADVSRAKVLRERACDAGHAPDCFALGLRQEKAKNLPKAASLFQRACDGGVAQACVKVGEAFSTGRGMERDPTAAVSALERACNAGSQEGCGAYGSVLLDQAHSEADRQRALGYLRNACKKGIGPSCDKLRSVGELSAL
jgi:TPR repeat protein